MTPAFRAAQIVQEINRHLRVFGHRIPCLLTDEGKEVGSRGARRWRPGTGSRYGDCIYCSERIEVALYSSRTLKGVGDNRYWISRHRRVYKPGGFITTYFELRENTNGFHLEGSPKKLLEQRRNHPETLVCPRFAVFL